MEMMKPEKAVEILKRHGQIVTVEQAQMILDFIYKLASIAVSQVLRNQERPAIHEHKKAS